MAPTRSSFPVRLKPPFESLKAALSRVEGPDTTYFARTPRCLETERARLLERDAEWARVASEGRDLERILSYWSDDTVTFPGCSVLARE